MRILYLHQYFNTPNMSGGTRSYEMARRLVAMGHEVNMVTSWRTGHDKKNWFVTDEAGITVHWLPVHYSNHLSYRERIRAFLDFAIKSSLKAATLEADIIFATSTPLTIALPAVYASRKKKIPMVFEVRDLWPEMPIAMGALKNKSLRYAARELERWAYSHSAAIVALSPGMKAGIASAGFPSKRISVIPNSSDNAEFAYNASSAKSFRSSRKWLRDKPLLCYAGTFGKVNGIRYAVSLAKALRDRDSDIRILLVGDGAERNLVIQEAKKAGVFESNLFVETEMPKKRIPELFSAATMSASFFIDLPEMQSNSSNKFFDALAAGKPVLINYGGWMHDLVSSNNCGLAMWRKPMEAVAAELDRVLHDPAWLCKAGQASRQLAEKYFDRDTLAAQLEQVLMAVIDGNPDYSEKIALGIYC
jgi:glycosyltransferase involved in cell wall biosynthesis